jgi:hypothetical protein
VLSPAPGFPVAMPAPPAPPIALSASVGSGPTQNPAPPSPIPVLPPLLIPPPAPRPDPWAAWTTPDHTAGVNRTGSIASASSEAFRQIGHSLTALLVATLGGVFARNRYHVYARDGHPPEPASPASRETTLSGSPSLES